MADQSTELLLAAVREFRAKARSAFELAKAAHSSTTKDAAQTIAAARELVEKAGLFGAALKMYDSTHHYHAWCKRDDWPTWNVIGVTNVKTYEEPLPYASAFTWGQHDWAFSLRDVSYFDDSKFGTLAVECDGQPVLELRIADHSNKDYDDWRLSDVEALVVGPWIAALTEMSTKMDLAENYRRLETQAAQTRKQAARIRL